MVRAGGLVVFPTETVYGLGANALDAAAVKGIFTAKGRPANNPVIVHVADVDRVREVAASWPDSAALLADRFWPGPLTLVLPRCERLPDAVTAGGPTVAVRIPAHPVALALLHAASLPIAAPSANRSTELSPTRAEHVLRGLDGRIDVLLDGGQTAGGIESTVLDLTAQPPRLLRPGLIGVAALEAIVGPVMRERALTAAAPNESQPLRSPGLMPRHYAPRTPLECVEGNGAARVASLLAEGRRVGWVTFSDSPNPYPEVMARRLPSDPAGYAARLYAVLHELDVAGLDRIVVTLPPHGDEWLAVRDRLQRAADAN